MTDRIHRHAGDERRGSQALAESLHLQQSIRDRERAVQKKRGRRRKGPVIDLDERTVVRPRGRRMLFVILTVESIIAVLAVCVLVAYLWFEGDTLR